MSNEEAYGLWPLVILNSFVFIIFAFSFAKPQTKRDWRSLGAFSAFIVALFTEMYGFPLTIYLLSGWIQTRFPGSDPFAHNAGHLWHALFGLKGDPHFDVFHIISYILIGVGFWILSAAWTCFIARSSTTSLRRLEFMRGCAIRNTSLSL